MEWLGDSGAVKLGNGAVMDGPEPDDRGNGRRRPAVVLIVVVLLVLAAVWVAQRLREGNRVQDCLMAGRTNCAPVP